MTFSVYNVFMTADSSVFKGFEMTVDYMFILIALALIFGVSLAFRSQYVNKYKNRYFICAVLVNIGILISEVGTDVAVAYSLRPLHIIMFTIKYSLAPLLPYCIVLMNRKCFKLAEKIAMIPALLVILIAVTSQYTGLLFYIDEANHYSRGPFYVGSLAISMVYFIALAVTSFCEYRDADFSEKIYLLAILFLAFGGIFVQVLIPDIVSMWATTGVSLLLYYTFVLELSNKYDILTGARNRRAFDAHKAILLNEKNYALVVFDINGLKPVNDNLGHEQGDKLIMGIADVLIASFFDVGKVYRIGGDEFCVICDEKNEEHIKEALENVEQNISKANRNRKDRLTLSVSYGWEIHKAHDTRDYKEVFNTADGRMYEMKQEFYKRNGGGRTGSNLSLKNTAK